MAQAISLVLKEDVDHLGKAGALVRVKPGFARNFLLPRGLALVATRGSVEEIERLRAAAIGRAEKQRQEAGGLASALAETTLLIEMAAGDEGRLFGAVTAKDIASLLAVKGYKVDRRAVMMPTEHIKVVGMHTVQVKLGYGVVASLQIDVRGRS